ncbi:hypothetical protein [Rhizohabitans arisaemae]|uniref:hypothetical protein n=1 Tax=Rhizohabitans arisaemae TaxID=2720610 RepID=UPI0024B126AB|nr:hypothetical protein [Rhizohabitans arisaemae]
MNESRLLETMRSQIPLRDPEELAMAIGWHPEEPRSRRTRRGLPPLPGGSPLVTARRLIAGSLVTAGIATIAVLGPSLMGGSATSYANSAIEINREGGQWVARIKDPLAEHEMYAKAFSAVGLNVRLQRVPASPSLVGGLVLTDGEGNPKPAGAFESGLEPENCRIGEDGCHLAFRAPVGFEGEIRAQLGRPAEPGELYQAANAANAEGEMLAGVDVDDRTVAQVLDEVRRRGLQVVYQLVKADPDSPTVNWLRGGKGAYSLTFESVPPDAVGADWLVWAAQSHSDGVVRLLVTPEPLKAVPPKPPVDGREGSDGL